EDALKEINEATHRYLFWTSDVSPIGFSWPLEIVQDLRRLISLDTISELGKASAMMLTSKETLLPLFAALLLRLAKVDFNGWFFAGLSVAALVISAAVIIMQSAGLSTLHSSVQQAATLLPDYGKLQALRLVLLALGLGCWLCPLIRRQPPRATGLLIG
ncbi:dimethyl sulfoxide reductase anchor subunit, partial [Escherichia coli]|nr:dimethyl sulfoxide reductase anchor subunit [Escherichia coli]